MRPAAKTRIVSVDQGFDFLGFRIQRQPKRGSGKPTVYTYPTKTALASVKAKVRTATQQGLNKPLAVLLHRLAPVLRGWTNYFRHGVSKAFYLYLRDPDGHRVEIYTTDYYTGDPDNPTVRWSVDDGRRRSFWGHAVVPSWYTEGSTVLDLDGEPVPLSAPVVREAERTGVVVGAAWNSSSDNPENQAFLEDFRTKYDAAPDQFAAQAFAGLMLVDQAVRADCSADREALKGALGELEDIPTVLGEFSIDENRDAVHPAVVQVVQDGKFAVLE